MKTKFGTELDRAELRRLILHPPSDLGAELLKPPHTPERLLAWAHNYAMGGCNAFTIGAQQMQAKNHVRAGDEVVQMRMSLDLCELAQDFVRILEEQVGSNIPEAEA